MPATDKDCLRKISLKKRQSVTPADHAVWSLSCIRRLIPLVESLTAVPGIVAGYFPIKTELVITPALASFAAHGRVVVLPRSVKGRKELRFYRWSEGDALARDIHGIPSPREYQDMLIPDTVIVPLLGFDRSGHRLGWGAGHYDATLATLRADKPIVAIGVAFALQEVASLPVSPHDQRLDIIVTEKEIISPTHP